jgi:hypothetical protein
MNETKYRIEGLILHAGESFNSGHYVYVKYYNGEPNQIISDSEIYNEIQYDVVDHRPYYTYKIGNTNKHYFDENTSVLLYKIINNNQLEETEKNILFKKFNISIPSTNFINSKFYDKKSYKYFLTNGANENLATWGSGTNGALRTIGREKFFLNAKQINDNNTYGETLNNGTVINNNILDNTVYYCDTHENYITGYPIFGVFHIKGIDWGKQQNKDDQLEILNIINVTKNYRKVIIVASRIAGEFPDENFILHLSCIPGLTFDGNDATKIGMIKAINELKSTLSFNLELQLDMDKNEYKSIIDNQTYVDFFNDEEMNKQAKQMGEQARKKYLKYKYKYLKISGQI